LISAMLSLLALTVSASASFQSMKQQYEACDKNDRHVVQRLLPELLLHSSLTSKTVGIAPIVKTQSQYPLALLEGGDINIVRVPSKVVPINGTINEWIGKRSYASATHRSTGLFAAPGEIVTLTIPENLVNKISVRIGHQHYQLDIGLMKKAKQKIASPYGGLILLVLHDKNLGMFDVTVENAIEAPYFVFGKSTNDDWSKMKHLAVPWTVLRVPGQVSIYIETLKVKSVTNMDSIMANVKKTMDVYDQMLGVPVGLQPGEETFFYDPKQKTSYTWVKEFAGVVSCQGGGGTVIAARYYPGLINKKFVPKALGYRGCNPDLPIAVGQSNADIVKRYIQIKTGLKKKDKWVSPWHILRNMVAFKIFSRGKPCYHFDEKKNFPWIYTRMSRYYGFYNCWTALYRLPLSEFGWDTFQKVLSLNADETKYSTIKYNSYKDKSDRLAELYCKATGHNMIPFFNFFNLNISASVATPCQAQPQPKKLTEYLKVANCIANKDKDCIKMPEYQEISKKFKGDCLISGVCQKDPENEYATTTYDNSIDIFPGKWTRNRKGRCFKRGIIYMVRCGNDEHHPITMTYRLKNGRSFSRTSPKKRLPAGNCYNSWQSMEVKNPVRFNKVRSNTMVPAECNKICKDKSYSYFGLRRGKLCFCGNKPLSPVRKLKMKRCNKMCTGNSSLRCGGGRTLNIFKVCTEANCNFSYE